MTLGNVHLTPQLVQAVRDTIDISEIAARQTKVEKRGDRLWALCPFHKEKTPSFSIDPVQGLYYCFGCGEGGDAISLHMHATGDDFPQAIETLAMEYGIPLPSRSSSRRSGEEAAEDIEDILQAAEKFFVEELARSTPTRRYLSERGISPEAVEHFRIGYAPSSYEALQSRLRDRYGSDRLEAAGLVGRAQKPPHRSYDRFRHRLMFPIRNPSGRLVGFGGRTLGDDRAKYVNTRETERFRKRSLLYGLDLARRRIRDRGEVLVVEGYFDLIAAYMSGVEWVVASMGTALSAEQARLCSRYADRVILCYDGDDAGREAQRRALPILLRQGLEVKQVDLAAGQDPDTVRCEAGPEALSVAIEGARDAVAVELEGLLPPAGETDPAAKARAAGAVRELLACIPDRILRFGYGQLASGRLGIPPELLDKPGAGNRATAREAPVDEGDGPQRPRVVTTLEEATLRHLLRSDEAVPPIGELPDREVFFDPICGNIYESYLALYGENESPPSAGRVRSVLSHEGETIDRLARILIEVSSCLDEGGLRDSLRELRDRWLRHRQRQLAVEINEAQRAGDLEKLQNLVEEKTSLTRQIHEIAVPS